MISYSEKNEDDFSKFDKNFSRNRATSSFGYFHG